MKRFHVISLFPDTVRPYLEDSILGRAQEDKVIAVKYYNPRDFTKDKHRRIDRRPYAGGPGMVIEAEPYLKAVEKAQGRKTDKKAKRTKVVFFATDGKQFTNKVARDYANKYDDIIFLCGRYEGIDARVQKITKAEKLSVGPFVLTGGEVPAMIVIDAVARQIEGVLGSFDSVEEARTASPVVYTRPEVLEWKKKKYRVPKVLLTGDHKKIEQWKQGILDKNNSASSNLDTVLATLKDEVHGDVASALKKLAKDYTMTWVYKSGDQLFPHTKKDVGDLAEAYVIKGREYHIVNIAEGDNVVMLELIESYPDPKTKKVYRTPLVLVLEMKNGKIQTGRHYCDPALSHMHLSEKEVANAFAKKKTPKVIK